VAERIEELGPMLRARRRAQRLSLRDVADQIDVSFNTLSRVERGHVPDLRNFQRIVDWLGVPAERFLEPEEAGPATVRAIVRHLDTDLQLSKEAAAEIASVVEEMYAELAGAQPPVAVQLRSAKTFTPKAGALLNEILEDMIVALEPDS
jgi:transcriptional regulator with XRE-family HTH domain